MISGVSPDPVAIMMSGWIESMKASNSAASLQIDWQFIITTFTLSSGVFFGSLELCSGDLPFWSSLDLDLLLRGFARTVQESAVELSAGGDMNRVEGKFVVSHVDERELHTHSEPSRNLYTSVSTLLQLCASTVHMSSNRWHVVQMWLLLNIECRRILDQSWFLNRQLKELWWCRAVNLRWLRCLHFAGVTIAMGLGWQGTVCKSRSIFEHWV